MISFPLFVTKKNFVWLHFTYWSHDLRQQSHQRVCIYLDTLYTEKSWKAQEKLKKFCQEKQIREVLMMIMMPCPFFCAVGGNIEMGAASAVANALCCNLLFRGAVFQKNHGFYFFIFLEAFRMFQMKRNAACICSMREKKEEKRLRTADEDETTMVMAIAMMMTMMVG